ncbi:MAG TPA: glycine zipper 2TM domain-containing protein [Ramlibacter sp.]|jgi:uncharacterized protein YcfJ|nr:glycine zipper 2TM domain-containing protein [Ramlibacter sp.]
MKHSILFATLGLVGFSAAAQEVGQVLSSTPVIQQVAVPRQVCTQGYATAPAQTSGAGGLMGAIAGGALGSTIGHGSGTVAAVLLGTVGGAILGNNIEGSGSQQVAVPTCTTETTYENRTVAYNVTYEYQGRQYQTQMPYDPGTTIRLQSSANAPAVAQGPAVSAPPLAQSAVPIVTHPAPVIVQGAPVYVQAPAPVVYAPYAVYPTPYPYYRPYYPPVGVSLGFVFRGGHRHHHHRRWR